MFLPLKDSNPLRVIPFQIVTAGLIAACVAVYLWQHFLPDREATRMILGLGAIPAVVTDRVALTPALALVPAWLTLVTAQFLHGGWLHLGGNMLYLWVFGDNIEDAMGHGRFLLFYLACGVAAGLAQVLSAPESINPVIGASGAVSGVLGAYLVLHPRVRVLVLAFKWLPLRLPAYLVLGGWAALQLFNSYLDGNGIGDGDVAWWAHIGGFIAGAILVVPMRRKAVPLFDRNAKGL